jgi:hypothetical protein
MMSPTRVCLATLLALVAIPVGAQTLAEASAAAKKVAHDWPASTNLGTPAPAPILTNSDLPDVPAATPSSAAVERLAASIRPKCALDWPDDFRMRAFCEKQQRASLDQIHSRNALMQSSPALTKIRLKCLTDWSKLGPMVNGERTLLIDFRMNNHCEETQMKALASLQ